MDLAVSMWRKASYSESQSDCVEVAMTESWAAIRDSKNPDGGKLTMSCDAFDAFTDAMKARHFRR